MPNKDALLVARVPDAPQQRAHQNQPAVAAPQEKVFYFFFVFHHYTNLIILCTFYHCLSNLGQHL
jgi:hypothetical protein